MSNLSSVKHTVEILSHVVAPCAECGFVDSSVAARINHYLAAHGYRVLHVGQHTNKEGGAIYHSTCALLGRDAARADCADALAEMLKNLRDQGGSDPLLP